MDIIRVYNIFRFPQERIFPVSRFATTKVGSIARGRLDLWIGPEEPGKVALKGIP